jgi:hypothetical protein
MECRRVGRILHVDRKRRVLLSHLVFVVHVYRSMAFPEDGADDEDAVATTSEEASAADAEVRDATGSISSDLGASDPVTSTMCAMESNRVEK